MISIRNILYPTDFSSGANQGFPHALQLARRYGADLHLLHVELPGEYDPSNTACFFPDEWVGVAPSEHPANRRADAFPSCYDVGDLEVERQIVRAISAAPAILRYSEDREIDLIMMATRGRRGLTHLFLGSVAEEVVRQAPCPVLTMRGRDQKVPAGGWSRILVPVDFSERSKLAFAIARETAARYDAGVDLVHVVEEHLHPVFLVAGKSSIFQVLPDRKKQALKKMQTLVASTPGPDVPVEIHVLEGGAGRGILEFAAENCSDLIVIGTHGLTGVKRFVLGSVAERVVRRSPCPVLTVKESGRSLIRTSPSALAG